MGADQEPSEERLQGGVRGVSADDVKQVGGSLGFAQYGAVGMEVVQGVGMSKFAFDPFAEFACGKGAEQLRGLSAAA